jgi:hypothetical protein
MSPWHPLVRLGGPQSRSGLGGEEKNSQIPPGISHVILLRNYDSYILAEWTIAGFQNIFFRGV